MHSSLHSDDVVQRHREEHDLTLRFSSSFSNAIVGRLNVCVSLPKEWALPSRLAHTAGSFFSWGLAPSTPLDLGEGCRMAAAEAYIQASIPRAILIQAVAILAQAILAQLLALFALFEVSLCVLFL